MHINTMIGMFILIDFKNKNYIIKKGWKILQHVEKLQTN